MFPRRNKYWHHLREKHWKEDVLNGNIPIVIVCYHFEVFKDFMKPGLKDVFTQSVEFNYLVVIAITTSFIFSFMTVKFFLIYINKFSMNAFVIYRILIALILFSIIY